MGLRSSIRRWRPFRKRERGFIAFSSGVVGDRRTGQLDLRSIEDAQALFEDILRAHNTLVAEGFEPGSADARHATKLLEDAEDCAHAIAEAYHNKAAVWVQRAERRIEATEAMRKVWRTAE